MADLNDILSEHNEKLSEQDLLNYLAKNATPENQQKIEEIIADSDFENDAVEGLQSIENVEVVKEHVKQLNKTLHKQLRGKKPRRKLKELKVSQWVVLTLLLLLLICIIGFIVIRMQTTSF